MNFEELANRAKERWSARHSSGRTIVYVNEGSCSLFAGVKAVKEAFLQACREHGIEVEMRTVGCPGTCFIEPQLDVVKPGRPRIAYGPLTPETARQLVESYLVGDDPRPDLAFVVFDDSPYQGIPASRDHVVYRHQIKRATRNIGTIDVGDIDDYLANDGYAGFAKALTLAPEEVVDIVKKSGLRGCGGASFPTGMKWEFCLRSPGPEKYFLCNADEGNAGTWKDRLLMEGDPHQLVEGMMIGAFAQRIPYGFIYIRDEYPIATHRVMEAIRQAEEYGLLGENILGSGFSFYLGVKEGAGAYLCGEESAMIASVEGSRGMPRARPPFPAQAGAWLKPTTVNNVETIANVPNILRNGAEWYAAVGTEKSKGVRVMTVSGAASRPGGYEVPFGMTFRSLFEIAGADLGNTKAVQMGGPATDIRPPDYVLDLPIALDELREKQTSIGSGGMVLIPKSTCIVDLVKCLAEFLRDESCGKCFPCRYGTQRQFELLDWITKGSGKAFDIREIERLAPTLQLGSLCGHGQVAHQPTQFTLLHFRDEYNAHVVDKVCPAGVCDMSAATDKKPREAALSAS